MVKKTVSYTDYNGNETNEELRFHIRRAELIDMDAEEGGLDGLIGRFMDENNNVKDMVGFLVFLKDLLLRGYGTVSADGKRFVKMPEAREAFSDSMAFEALLDDLLDHPDGIVPFVEGMLPKAENSK